MEVMSVQLSPVFSFSVYEIQVILHLGAITPTRKLVESKYVAWSEASKFSLPGVVNET